MMQLVIATVIFVGMHFVFSDPAVRPRIVARTGEQSFAGVYSVISGAALAWMIWSFAGAPVVALWFFGAARWIAVPLVALALLLLVCGVSGYNPTAVGRHIDADRSDFAPGIMKVTRHPVMWGIGLFALAHLLANGHLAALIFFGGLAVLALGGTRRLDAKHRRRDPEVYTRFAAATSNLPFASIFAGRHRIGAAIAEIGLPRLAATAVLFFLLLAAHPWIAGRPIGLF